MGLIATGSCVNRHSLQHYPYTACTLLPHQVYDPDSYTHGMNLNPCHIPLVTFIPYLIPPSPVGGFETMMEETPLPGSGCTTDTSCCCWHRSEVYCWLSVIYTYLIDDCNRIYVCHTNRRRRKKRHLTTYTSYLSVHLWSSICNLYVFCLLVFVPLWNWQKSNLAE